MRWLIHVICSYARQGHVAELQKKPIKHKRPLHMPLRWRFRVAHIFLGKSDPVGRGGKGNSIGGQVNAKR